MSEKNSQDLINPLIFRAYDIRGIAEAQPESRDENGKILHAAKPADLTENSVYLIGLAVGTYLKRKYNVRTIAVGRDNRLTGEDLQNAYIRGLLEVGLKVTNIGISPSPMVYWASCAEISSIQFDAATNITASHNPKEYNGLKIVTRGAHSICGDELQEVLKLIQNQDFDRLETLDPKDLEGNVENSKTNGNLKTLDIWPQYKAELLKKVKLHKPLKIVIDAGNGVTGPYAPELFRQFGCEVIELYCELDGNFPNHEANPEELENMQDLIAAVRENNADLGIGFDGDGDRVGVIDEKGNHYSADYLLLLLTRDLTTRLQNPKVVFDVKVSQVIIDAMAEAGADPVMHKTGHSFIENKMKEVNAPLGGEISGHMFFAENYYGFDDAFLAALKILEILSNKSQPFSELFNDLPKVITTPEFKSHCPDDRKFQVVQNLVDHFTKIYDCTTIDGVRINFGDKTWAAVRASNTSPNLTLRFEAKTEEKLQEIQKIMAEQLQKYPEVDIWWHEI